MDSKTLFLDIVEFHTNLKLYHFQTKSYGGHKASDTLVESLSEKYDKFFEVYQGQYGRIPAINHTIRVKTISDKDIIPYAKAFVLLLKQHSSTFCQQRTNSQICNIMDEMAADVDQFIYLKTFR